MLDFLYHIKFEKIDDDFNISIFLSLEDLFTPVYIRSYDPEVLANKVYFEMVYNEFKEYLNYTNIAISKEDLQLLVDIIKEYHLPKPKLLSVKLDEYDPDLDEYINILTTKEILYLIFIDGLEVNHKRIKTWEVDNHLNAAYLTEVLLEAGYITKDDYERNLPKAARALLESVVKKFDLDVRGDNKDLIDGIERALTKEEIKEHFCGTHYHLTDKGKAIVNNTHKLNEFHRSYYQHVENMRIEEFHLLSIKKSGYNFQAVSRLLLNEANKSDVKLLDWDYVLEYQSTSKEQLPNPSVVDYSVDEEYEISQTKEIDEATITEVIPNEQELDKLVPGDDEFFNILSKVNVSFEEEPVKEEVTDDTVVTETLITSEEVENDTPSFTEEQEVKDESTEVENKADDLSEQPIEFDEDYKIKESLKEYQKRRAYYEKHQQIIANPHNKKRHTRKRRVRNTYFMLFLLLILIVSITGFLVYTGVITIEEIKEYYADYYQKAERFIEQLIEKYFKNV